MPDATEAELADATASCNEPTTAPRTSPARKEGCLAETAGSQLARRPRSGRKPPTSPARHLPTRRRAPTACRRPVGAGDPTTDLRSPAPKPTSRGDPAFATLDHYLHQRTGGMIGSLSHLVRSSGLDPRPVRHSRFLSPGRGTQPRDDSLAQNINRLTQSGPRRSATCPGPDSSRPDSHRTRGAGLPCHRLAFVK